MCLGNSAVAEYTLYIDMRMFDIILVRFRYGGEGESVVHLMSGNMLCRIDPFPNALFYNSYGIVNL